MESNVIAVHNNLDRLCSLSIKKVFNYIKNNPQENYIEVCNGLKVSIKRAKIFYKKGITCCNCGTIGEFFAIEKDKGGGIHLDLYGYVDKEDNEEVLLTIDHIIPKSKGGKNSLINYQTMCKLCNEYKSDNI